MYSDPNMSKCTTVYIRQNRQHTRYYDTHLSYVPAQTSEYREKMIVVEATLHPKSVGSSYKKTMECYNHQQQFECIVPNGMNYTKDLFRNILISTTSH